jgi:hypothetical protein
MQAAFFRAGLAFVAAGLVGCAPGAWNEQSPFDQFIYKLQSVCPYARAGQWQMYSGGAQLVNNATFLDLTSRLYYGKISRSQYASAVAAQTFGREDDPAIQCVFNNLPGGTGEGSSSGPMYAPPPPQNR